VPVVPPVTFPDEPVRPIIREICNNTLGAFSGFGRHLANDFLFRIWTFPGTPSHVICSNDEHFNRFKRELFVFMDALNTPEFADKVTCVPNSQSPFAFNDKSNQVYMESYIDVFRRMNVRVTKELYTQYCLAGMLDHDHTIGERNLVQVFLVFNYVTPGEPYPRGKAEQKLKTDLVIPQSKASKKGVVHRGKRKRGSDGRLERMSSPELDDHTEEIVVQTRQFKWLKVYFYPELKAYSVICAIPPSGWGDNLHTRVQ